MSEWHYRTENTHQNLPFRFHVPLLRIRHFCKRLFLLRYSVRPFVQEPHNRIIKWTMRFHTEQIPTTFHSWFYCLGMYRLIQQQRILMFLLPEINSRYFFFLLKLLISGFQIEMFWCLATLYIGFQFVLHFSETVAKQQSELCWKEALLQAKP